MGDIKLNVSYSGLSRELSSLKYGIKKMTDGYLKEIAEVGRERLEQAYGEEYDAANDYDGIKPRLKVKRRKTKGGYYKLVVQGANAALLEYGTGYWAGDEYEGDLPSGWADHVPLPPPDNSGKKDYWYFEIPSGLAENDAWDHVKYPRQVGRPARPKKILGSGVYGEEGFSVVDKSDPLFQAWQAYDEWMANPAYEMVTSKRFGVAYGHLPANGLPKARKAMLAQAEESAKKFYLRKYK